MKKVIYLLLFVFFATISTNAQISGTSCDDFRNYHFMKDNKKNLKTKEFDDCVAYGKTKSNAKYNAKIEVLKSLTGNQKYLNNPLVDSIMSEFAGELIFLIKGEYDIYKTKGADKDYGKYTCRVNEIKYNPNLIEYLEYHINNFIKYSAVFIINPNITEFGDKPSKELYKMSKEKLHTSFLSAKYKFDNVIEYRLLKLGTLSDPPSNYNPCNNGFKYYNTGNKYLDFITRIQTNEGRSRQVDIVFSVDTITFYTIEGTSDRVVTIHVIGYNTHTATEILVYDSQDTVENSYSDKQALEELLRKKYGEDAHGDPIISIFGRDIDKYMYQVTKRYSSYVRDGMLFAIKICSNRMNDNIEMDLEEKLIDCRLFADASIASGEWYSNGGSIGKSYEGRSYMLDRLKLKIRIRRMLIDSGLEDFKIDLSGTDFIITPK